MGLPQPVPLNTPFINFPGGSFNALVAGYHAQRGNRQPGAQHNFVVSGVGPQLKVKVKNGTGIRIEPGHVLGINGLLVPYSVYMNVGGIPTAQPANTRQVYSPPMFNCLSPLASEPNKFVVAIEQIRDGKIGWTVLMGAVWVRLDVLDSSHKFAKVKNLVTDFMETGASGAIIIFKEKQGEAEESQKTGVQWALIIIGGGAGGNEPSIVKSTGIIPAATTAGPGLSTSYVNVKGPTVTGEIENRSGKQIPANLELGVITIAGDWVIWPAYCAVIA